MSALRLLPMSLLILSACAQPGAEPFPLGDSAAGGNQFATTEAALNATCVTISRSGGHGVADAWLRSDRATLNLGSFPQILAGRTGKEGLRRSLIRFSLAAVPSNATIVSSTMTLRQFGNNGAGTLDVHRAMSPWTESSVSWSSGSTNFAPGPVASFSNNGLGWVGSISVDLTGLTKDWYSGATANHGVMIKEPVPTPLANSGWDASEGPAAVQPRLSVCYVLPTCDDGIQNGSETGVDCGGTCPPCDLCEGVVCSPLDECHVAGVCDPATGLCSNPTAPDGTVCDDGSECTNPDQCQAGVCSGPFQCNQTCGCDVIAVAGGVQHALALRATGAVLSWGSNAAGQLGLGTFANSSIPVAVPGLPPITAIAASEYHSLALDNTGAVWAWGWNNLGQLGQLTFGNFPSPTKVPGLSGVTAIAAGYRHTAVLKSNGQVLVFGYNGYGQLGQGYQDFNANPVPKVVPLPGPATAIAAGVYNASAIVNGGVWTWGYGLDGQLGNGQLIYSYSPVLASAMGGVTSITLGNNHAAAVSAGGPASSTWASGQNSVNQLGNGTTTSSSVHGLVLTAAATPLVGLTQVSAGASHTLGRDGAGELVAWGHGLYNQLGRGVLVNGPYAKPVLASANVPFGPTIAFSAGGFFSLAVRPDGTAWAFGQNVNGQLGQGHTSPVAFPVRVQGL